MRPLSIALIAFFFVCPPAWGKDRIRAQRSYELALESYLRGDFQRALTALSDTLEDNSAHTAAFALRARVWHVIGDHWQMKKDAQRTLDRFSGISRKAQDYVAQGSALLLLDRPDEALSSFTAAFTWKKDSMEALAGRARVWRARGKPERALEDLDIVIKRAPRKALYLYNRAHAYYDLGRYDKALRDLTKALRINRRFHLAFGMLGSALAQKGDMKRALKAYSRAIKLDKNYVYAYLGRAAVYIARNEDDAALADFAAAIKVRPRDYSPYYNRADMLWARGNREDALNDYREALKADLPDAASAIIIGDRFTKLRLWDDALTAYTRAYDISGRADPLIHRSKAYMALKQPKKAMKDLSDAVSLEPRSAKAWVARALLSVRMGMEKQARKDLGRAFKLDPKNPKVLAARGRVSASSGKPREALADFNRAIALDPGFAEAYNDRGALRANAFFQHSKALADIEKAVKLSPRNAGFLFNLGVMKHKSKQYLQALRTFERAKLLGGFAPRILQRQADTNSRLGRHKTALKLIKLAIEKSPSDSSLYETLGRMRLRNFDYVQAREDFDQALDLDSSNVKAFVGRGLAYGGLGRTKKALKDFRKAGKLDPMNKDAWTNLCWARRLRREPRKAIAECTQAIAIDANHAPAYLHRGLAYLDEGNAYRAIESLNQAYHLGARVPEALLAQSIAHASVRQFKQAHDLYWRAINLAPTTRSSLLVFGTTGGKYDDYYNEIGDLEDLLDEDPTDPYAYIVKGDSLHNVGYYDKAVMEYTKAMEIDGTLSDAYISRGIALTDQDSLNAAHQDFLQAIELAPRDTAAHLHLAVLLTYKHSYKSARISVNKALKIDDSSGEAYLRAGNLDFFQKKYKRALKNYKLAVKFSPEDPNMRNGLGLGYFTLRRYPQALASFTRAISINGRSDKYYRNRGSTNTSLKDYSSAAIEFKSAGLLNTDPTRVDEYNNLIHEAESRIAVKNSEKSSGGRL